MKGLRNRYTKHCSGLWRPRMALTLEPQWRQINVVVDIMHTHYCVHTQNRGISVCMIVLGASLNRGFFVDPT